MVWRRGCPDYPDALEDLSHPPEKLYAIGDRAMLDAPRFDRGTRDQPVMDFGRRGQSLARWRGRECQW